MPKTIKKRAAREMVEGKRIFILKISKEGPKELADFLRKLDEIFTENSRL